MLREFCWANNNNSVPATNIYNIQNCYILCMSSVVKQEK